MENKLKPCPFCGGNAKVRETGYRKWDGSHRRFYIVECECCNANIENDKKEEAITTWNTRKLMDRIVEQLEEQTAYVGCSFAPKEKMTKIIKTDKAIAIVKGVQNE